MRVFGTARFAITAGMLAGWVLGYASPLLPFGIPPVQFTVAIMAIVVTATSTLVFTEKEVFAAQGVADERILQESPERNATETANFAESLESFGETWGIPNAKWNCSTSSTPSALNAPQSDAPPLPNLKQPTKQPRTT